ncbi:MAG TPA: HlyD family efflux transporter periplasmic adaptor subunit [Dehalococcoidia bacterium]|nr:HlyD family efflux transporter periplasmic adaptor subunit [Dehalococcoidia bacterium]
MVTEAGTQNGIKPPPQVDQQAHLEPANSSTPRRRLLQSLNLRPLIVPVAVLGVLLAGVFIINAIVSSRWYVSTDNAQVAGTPVAVGPLNAGRVEQVYVRAGSQVRRGESLARLLLPTVSNSARIEEDIRAPFDGVVIEVPVGAGTTVSAGQAIVTVVNPNELYVNANIDETSVGKVQAGQPVDVHVDALNQDLLGQVTAVTDASAATFSLLPSQNNSSGSFTKVNQNVPVRIDVDDLSDQPLLVGTSVEVKIHVAGH